MNGVLTCPPTDENGDPLPADIQALILDMLPLTSLDALSKLPLMREVIRAKLKAKIDNILTAFSLDADACLSMMERAGAILSGSAALYVVAPGYAAPNDLNFYCPKHAAKGVATYFSRSPGYTKVSNPTIRVVAERSPFNILDAITLSESISTSPLVPLFSFHSTTLMNCISGRGVLSFYPKLTEQYVGELYEGLFQCR
ncbi:hypothetical protein DFP72DRAFT_810809 [Ephemerocybe angulata]|uniref:Uncharacterized protein n=1 Tax=Ephemerocybe angulata TaxID=980116 RepID=A0A8H6M8L0_9AGAR|nr:hypothetical protein DFP72DRAFT_810809 [Tulosesus angulatus]